MCRACTRDSMHACAAQENAARLKAYKAKLVLFPRRSKKPKAGDAGGEELAVAGKQQLAGARMPLVREKAALETVEITDEMRVRAPPCHARVRACMRTCVLSASHACIHCGALWRVQLLTFSPRHLAVGSVPVAHIGF